MRRRIALAALAVAIAVAALGTLLWIAGILRPEPHVAPGRIVSAIRRGETLDLTVVVAGAAPIDRAGETVRQVARAIASGALPASPIAFDVRDGRTPVMRLVYDPGILASGAVAGGTGDHMLGLAGAGSRWPAHGDPRVYAYCGRMETMTRPFCKRVAER